MNEKEYLDKAKSIVEYVRSKGADIPLPEYENEDIRLNDTF